MRLPAEVEKEDLEVSEQISTLKKEIDAKEIDLARLQELNLQLLTKNIQKSKRPASLRTQTEKLKTLEIEIGQLKSVVPLLQAKRAELGDESKVAKAGQALVGYFEKSRSFFGKIEKAMAVLQGMVELTVELEKIVGEIRESDPLHQLSDIFGGLKTVDQFNALNFPEDEFARYRLFNRIMELEKRVKHLPNVIKNLSDFGFYLEYTELRNLKIPTAKRDLGVIKSGSGPRTRISQSGPPDISKNPARYTEADVKKYGIQAANRR